MRKNNNLYNRLKGLIGIILSTSLLVCSNSVSVYAEMLTITSENYNTSTVIGYEFNATNNDFTTETTDDIGGMTKLVLDGSPISVTPYREKVENFTRKGTINFSDSSLLGYKGLKVTESNLNNIVGGNKPYWNPAVILTYDSSFNGEQYNQYTLTVIKIPYKIYIYDSYYGLESSKCIITDDCYDGKVSAPSVEQIEQSIGHKLGGSVDGWSTNIDGLTVEVNEGGKFVFNDFTKINQDVKVYPDISNYSWDYYIDGNGGTRSNGESNYSSGNSGSYSGGQTFYLQYYNDFSKTGYNLKGFSNSAESREPIYQSNGSFTFYPSKSLDLLKLYATWQPWSYNIYYYLDYSVDGVDQKIHEIASYDETKHAIEAPTRPGYGFKYWYDPSDQSDPVVEIHPNDTLTYKPSEDGASYNLKAKWEEYQYKIEFDGNGGIDSSSNSSKYSADLNTTDSFAVLSSAEGFNRAGYVFKGWEDSSGKVYNIGDSITYLPTKNNDTYKICAIWEPITYTVKYDGNGGYIDSNPIQHTKEDNTASLSNNKVKDYGFIKQGYKFAGWSATIDGIPTTLFAEGTINYTPTGTQGETITLTANWVPYTYTIKYDGNGGTNTVSGNSYTDPNSYNTESTLELLWNLFTRAGYKLIGYDPNSTNPNIDAIVYKYPQVGDNVYTGASKDNDELLLHAIWEELYYKARYNGNGGTLSDGATTKTSESLGAETTYEVMAHGFTRPGYEFWGWHDSATIPEDLSEVKHKVTDVGGMRDIPTENNQIIDLYAAWKPIEYTVKYSYKDNDGNTLTQDATVTYGSATAITCPTRRGFTFDHWEYTDSGSPVSVNASGSINYIPATSSSVLNMTAVYNEFTYKIKYFGNGGASDTASSIVSDPIAYSAEPLAITNQGFTRTGYDFAGWHNSQDIPSDLSQITFNKDAGGGIKYYPYANDTTYNLYAVWVPWTYSVEWNANDGKLSNGNNTLTETHTYDSTVSVPNLGCTRPGYQFLGWKYNTTTYDPGQTISFESITKGTTFVVNAQWRDISVAENTTMSSGSFVLGLGKAYKMHSSGKVSGDSTTYAGGVTFYVRNAGSYTFQ